MERKPLIAIHAPMLATSTVDSASFIESSPSPIKATDNSMQMSTEQLAGTSLLMHSSFGVHRRHSDDVTSASFTTTTTFRPRRSISSSAGQQQTRHVACMLNNYSHSLPSQTQTDIDDDQTVKHSNHNLTQDHEDLFNDDDDDELNLAVVVGSEDIQSLKEYANNENGSLDVAFIDETDLERNLSHHKQAVENEQVTTQNETVVNENSNAKQESIPVLTEKTLNKDNDLDEILRRNEHRCIRLTDSDVNHVFNFFKLYSLFFLFSG